MIDIYALSTGNIAILKCQILMIKMFMIHAISIVRSVMMEKKININTAQDQPGIHFRRVETITCLNVIAIINKKIIKKLKFAF
jgi:hypothetical protein